jgi:hypothetical protein
MAERHIDWSSAEVKGSKLSVAIGGDGENAKQWSARVQSVLKVLDRSGGRWGEIKVAKDKIEVADLREGSEPELRHLLESAVLQANADLAPDDDEDSEDGSQKDGDDGEDGEGRSADAEMTGAFRSFASGSEDEEQDDDDDDGKSSRD